jgi:hypothetical protein
MTEDDKKIEILSVMEHSLLDASHLVSAYGLAFGTSIKDRIRYMMNLWQEFYGEPHPIAKEFEFLKK